MTSKRKDHAYRLASLLVVGAAFITDTPAKCGGPGDHRLNWWRL